MLKKVRRYERRLAWVSLAGLLLFAMGPFALVPMTVWMGAPCANEESQVAEAGHATAGDHHSADHHSADQQLPDDYAAASRGSCPSDHCPASDTHCCGAPSCGASAVLAHSGGAVLSGDLPGVPPCLQSPGNSIVISLTRPPAA